jgi:sugar phosphate isomerase/epimerase
MARRQNGNSPLALLPSCPFLFDWEVIVINVEFTPGVSMRLPGNLDKDDTLQQLAASGLSAVELMYISDFTKPGWLKRVRKTLTDSNILINSVHAPFSNEVDISRCDNGGQECAIAAIAMSIEMAKQLGAGILVVHASAEPIKETEREQRLAQSSKGLAALVKMVEPLGIRLAVELLPRTCLGNTAEELIQLVEQHPQEQVGICLDTNHLADPSKLPEYVEMFQHRLITTHISDYDGIDEKHWIPFTGVIDWDAFAYALHRISYRGAFIYEVTLDKNLLAAEFENILGNFDRIIGAK